MTTLARSFAAATSPGALAQPALIDALGGEVLDHGALVAALGRVASQLQASGVQPGDVVVISGPNSIDLAVTLIGTMSYGAIAAPLNPKLTPREVEVVVRHSGARVALAEPEIALPGAVDRIGGLAAWRGAPVSPIALVDQPVTGDSPALLIYTSGTTGRPKGVLLRHRNLVANVRTAIEWFGLAPGHRTLCLLPLFHTFGIISDVLPMLFVGGSAVIAPVFDITRLAELGDALVRHRVRSFSAVPLMFDLMLRLGMRFDGGELQFCVSGAAPLHPRTVAGFRDHHAVRILPAYGMTETTCFISITRPSEDWVVGSAGRPANVGVRIVDAEGRDLAPPAIGEIAVCGDNVHRTGYFRDELPCWLDAERRWFRTGDLGFVDAGGWLHVTGRAKNMVIRGGEKVYLEDLDRALAGLPGVGDTASVGVVRGELERIVTFVVRAEPALDERAVRDHLLREVGATKASDVVVFCDAIPRTITNKVKIAELQARAEAYL